MTNLQQTIEHAKAILVDLEMAYSVDYRLPNLCYFEDDTGDVMRLAIELGEEDLNLTIEMNVVELPSKECYLELTVYYTHDKFYVNRDGLSFSLRGSPLGRVFNDYYVVTGGNLSEAMLNAFSVAHEKIEYGIGKISS